MTTATKTRTFEVDLTQAGIHRRKDWDDAVKRLKGCGFTFDSSTKVWTLVDEDGDTPEAFYHWEYARRLGVTYTETTED